MAGNSYIKNLCLDTTLTTILTNKNISFAISIQILTEKRTNICDNRNNH